MFNLSTLLADGLLPETNPWLSGAIRNPPLRTINPLMTPEEPTTLALAIVGLGTIGAFVAFQRWRRTIAEQSDLSEQSLHERSIRVEDERRSRGAA